MSYCWWRLLQNRIVTKDNLVRRHVLTINDHLCTGRCGCIEDTNHLFVSCVFYSNLWYLIYDWLGFSSATSPSLLLHLRHFCGLGGVSNKLNSAFNMIWLAAFYVIWKESNGRIFQQKKNSIVLISEQVKCLVFFFFWFKSKFVSFNFHYNVWRQSPLMCLSAVT